MSTKDALDVIAAGFAILGGLWLASRKIFAPHAEKAISKVIRTEVGTQLAEVPRLTQAVDKLTTAIEAQTRDTERLNTSIERLDERVATVSDQFSGLAQRTTAVEKDVESLKAAPKRRRKAS